MIGGAAKRLIKRGLYATLGASGAVRRRLRREARQGSLPAHILVYHRVLPESDPADGLTVRLESFRRQMEMLAGNFRVLRLGELLDLLEAGKPFTGPTACVTFDDGYEDNYRWAARVLEEIGLPACFFVTTGYLATRRVFPWDRESPVGHPMMTWEQVRELGAAGFEIGSHTVNHVDLGQVSREEAGRELAESRQRIAAETGRAPDLFAYPFGGPGNFRPEMAEVVRRQGYRCCVSAYGGLVRPGDDPFALRRLPVTPFFRRPSELRMEMERVFCAGVFRWRKRRAD